MGLSSSPPSLSSLVLSLPLHDALQLRQLVLDQQHLLQDHLLCHHYHVRLAIKADLGNLLCPKRLRHSSCDSPARMWHRMSGWGEITALQDVACNEITRQGW